MIRQAEPTDLPRRLNELASAALERASGGLLLESDRETQIPYLYVETHCALLLYLLNGDGLREQGLQECATRLRVWDELQITPIFFSAMAIALVGVLAREDGVEHDELNAALSGLLARRRDFTEQAWGWPCGNNMLLQQIVTDSLLVPLAEGRAPDADAAGSLHNAFAQCMGGDGFFFDLPRPGAEGTHEYPLTYNLKFLFLLVLCQHFLPDERFLGLLRRSITATMELMTRDGDSSFFGRTDRTTFAAGLSSFCLRAAAEWNIGGDAVATLAIRAEQRLLNFPVGEDGCFEVNEYPLPASSHDLILSRDMYAFRWQYAVSGAAYCLLGRRLFQGDLQHGSEPQPANSHYHTADLGITRISRDATDLFVRSDTLIENLDRRHAGPTILRVEHAGRTIVGTIPISFATDPTTALDRQALSSLGWHSNLIRYRWREGDERLHSELAGFVPVILSGNVAWVPRSAETSDVDTSTVRSTHGFREITRRGWRPLRNHFAVLLRSRAPAALRKYFVERPLLGDTVGARLERSVELDGGEVTVRDRITGCSDSATVRIATRSLTDQQWTVAGLEPVTTTTGWSSEGPQKIAVYEARPVDGLCSYELRLSLAVTSPATPS